MKSFASVAVVAPVNQRYTYISSTEITVGQIVRVPFGRRSILGVVWDFVEALPSNVSCIKSIEEICAPYFLQEPMRRFIDWMAHYTMIPLGSLLRMCLSVPTAFDPPSKKRRELVLSWPEALSSFSLSSAQQKSAEALVSAIYAKVFHPFFLDGVTGSGKTEVYLHAAQEAVNNGRQVLVLLPEIALTETVMTRCQQHLGYSPILWHSAQTSAQKREIWKNVALGRAAIVVGARSALFLPFPRLGLIVVDEEHDTSYKQEEGGFYNARDMAIVRAKCETVPVVLSSATPSLETFLNAQKGRYTTLRLQHRYQEAKLPSITLIDLRKEKKEPLSYHSQTCLSATLIQRMRETLQNKEQVLLYVNRRGYAPITLCRACGEKIPCPNCATYLVDHKRRSILLCHYCGYTITRPHTCPKCASEELISWGIGAEHVLEEVEQRFPEVSAALASSDALNSPQKMRQFIQDVQEDAIQVVVGTRILAKGHHFPKITCVGVVDADFAPAAEDIRAYEYAFQLLQQVAGRAGRADRPGRVYMQTYNPDQPIFQVLNDRDTFLHEEARLRKAAKMPPFTHLVALILSGLNAAMIEHVVADFVRKAPQDNTVDILGPIPAPLAYLKGRYRWRILVRATRHASLIAFLEKWCSCAPLPRTCRLEIDVDPMSFL
ncbi:MAG: primosomal protein N' [Holosporales bacterium]|jgi:primosomal protein N' (replication factor Y)|nr:primosomal protein N' [Holosporales bacterium]